MEILLPLVYSLLFILIIFRTPFFMLEGLSRKSLSGFFLIKIFSGLVLWAIYTFYYTDRSSNDIFKYFDDAEVMFRALPEQPLHYLQMLFGINADTTYLKPYYMEMNNWYKPWDTATLNDNRTIIRFNAFLYLFSFGYYNVHTVFMCFLSFTGLTAIYKLFYPFLKSKARELAVATYLIPSVLFWGSGVLKEGVLLFGFGILIYYFYHFLFYKRTVTYFLWIAFSAFILFLTKVYVILAFIPSIVSLILIKITGNRQVFLKFFGVHILFFILAVNLYRLNAEWDLLYTLHQKQKDFINVALESDAGSFITTKILEPNAFSLIKNSPEAIINTLLRPHFLESKTFFMIMAAAENLLIILLVLTSFIFFKKPDMEQRPILYTSVFFVFTLALLIGLVTPVLGAIVRYKVPLLPFFALIFILLMNKEKVIKRLSFLRLTKKNESTI